MGNPNFLSRPRRFGKSLLLSTIEAYFQKKSIYSKGWQSPKENRNGMCILYCICEKYDTQQGLFDILERQLTDWEKLYNINGAGSHFGRFITIIEKAFRDSGQHVVVLIDEHDKPLLHTFHNEALQQSFRELLTAFYSVLKTADQWSHFVLITGITKFAQMDIFSNLNQLKDISFDSRFVEICGMTRTEIEQNFPEGLQVMVEDRKMTYPQVIEELAQRYDGYHFEEEQTECMFNPFSVLKALSNKRFKDYWFASGTPTFLVEMLEQTSYDLRNLDGVSVYASSLMDDQADSNNPIPMI